MPINHECKDLNLLRSILSLYNIMLLLFSTLEVFFFIYLVRNPAKWTAEFVSMLFDNVHQRNYNSQSDFTTASCLYNKYCLRKANCYILSWNLWEVGMS